MSNNFFDEPREGWCREAHYPLPPGEVLGTGRLGHTEPPIYDSLNGFNARLLSHRQ